MPDHAPDNAHRQAAWSRYWKQDVLHSLPGSFSGNYAGRIERFWLDSFAALGSGQRMLDIATGNGPIPQLACTHCAGRAAGMPRLDAIDLAQVAPAWVSSPPAPCRPALHFHSGVAATTEERRVGKECVLTFRSRRSPYHSKKKKTIKHIN